MGSTPDSHTVGDALVLERMPSRKIPSCFRVPQASVLDSSACHHKNIVRTHLLGNQPSFQDQESCRNKPIIVEQDLQRQARTDLARISATVGPRVLSVSLHHVGVVVGGGDGSGGGGAQSPISSPSSKHHWTICRWDRC